MTTTKLFQGLDSEGKNSSRVLRPPGGASSNIFGDPAPASPVKPASQPKPQDNGVLDGGTASPSTVTAPAQNASATSHDKLFGGSDADKSQTPSKSENEDENKSEEDEESNNNANKEQENSQSAAGSDSLPRGGFNPITGEKYGAGAADASNATSSTRVRQPPGGASSGLW